MLPVVFHEQIELSKLLVWFIFAATFLFVTSQGALADAAVSRADHDRVLQTLKLHPEEASNACILVMKAVHDSEREIKRASNKSRDLTPPQYEIGLASNYQNAVQICGVDASRICREIVDTRTTRACSMLATIPGR